MRRIPSLVRAKGFTLVELLLVLGIILIIGGTVIMAARYVSDRTTTTRMVDQSTSIVQSVDAVYTNSLGYDTALSPTVALNNGALSPSQLTGGELRDSLGHPVSLSSAARSGQDGAVLQIGFEQLPSRVCSNLASAAASGFDEVKVGGTTVKSPSQRVVDIAAVTSACVGDNATVTLVHYSPAAYQGPAADGGTGTGASGTMPTHGSSQPADLTKLDNADGHHGVNAIAGVGVTNGAWTPGNKPTSGLSPSGSGSGTSGIPNTGQTAPPGIDQPPAEPPAGAASISSFKVCLTLGSASNPTLLSRCKTTPDQTLAGAGLTALTLNCATTTECPNDAAWQSALGTATTITMVFTGQLRIYMRPDPAMGDTFAAGWANFNLIDTCSGPVTTSGAGNPVICYVTHASGDKKVMAGVGGYVAKANNTASVVAFVLRTVKLWPGANSFDTSGQNTQSGTIGASTYQWAWSGSPLQNSPSVLSNRGYCPIANYSCFIDGKAVNKTATIFATDTP